MPAAPREILCAEELEDKMQHVLRLRIWVRWHCLGTSVSAQKGVVRTLKITGRVMERGDDVPRDSVFDLEEARVYIFRQPIPRSMWAAWAA